MLRDPLQPLLSSPLRRPDDAPRLWTPLSIAADFWSDPSDLASAFQDSAGTTPGAIGQQVGRRVDKSGRGNNVLQATGANRPLLVASPFAADRADGVNDSLASTTGGGGTAGILICAALTVSGGAGTVRQVFDNRGTNTGYFCSINAGNNVQFSAGSGAAFTPAVTVATFPVGETHVITAWDDGSTLNVQIDNGAVATVARPAVVAGSAGFTLMKSNVFAGEFFNGDLHQLVYVKNTARTAAERAALKRFAGSKVGLAL